MMMTDEEIEYQQDQAEAALEELGQIAPGIAIPTHVDQLLNIIQRSIDRSVCHETTINNMNATHMQLQDLFSTLLDRNATLQFEFNQLLDDR